MKKGILIGKSIKLEVPIEMEIKKDVLLSSDQFIKDVSEGKIELDIWSFNSDKLRKNDTDTTN